MSEKTLLVELEKEKEKIVEKKLALQRKEAEKKRENKEEKKADKKYFNAFSSKSYKGASFERAMPVKEEVAPAQPQLSKESLSEEQEIAKIESKVSTTIEKPNYDYMEGLSDKQREKIFKIERQEETKTKARPSRLKAVVLSIIFALFGVWGIVNIAQLDTVGSQLAEVAYQYEMNLPKYLQKLTNLDATSSENMENLFETIPDEDLSPSEIIEKSNWFDRFCNFIAGLFGG